MAENGEPEASDSLKGFGEVVKGFRERAGLTREEFALRVCCSKHTIISIEVGRRMPPPRFPEMADEALDADGIIVRAAKHLSRNPGLAAWFERWAELEAQAINLCTYECRVVPGLLQSEAYVRALFHGRVPPLSDEQIETQVAARIERQRLLRDRPNTAYSFVVEEAMFLRRTGGAEVTRQLIGHVLACAEMRNVELQVMPLVRETHAGLDGPVQLLETPENEWFGYSEGQRGGQFFSDRKEISVLQTRYAKLRSQALTPEDSVSLLRQVRGEL